MPLLGSSRLCGKGGAIRDHEDGRFDILVDERLVAAYELSPVKGKTYLTPRHYKGIAHGEACLKRRLPLLSQMPPVSVEERPLSTYEILAGDRG